MAESILTEKPIEEIRREAEAKAKEAKPQVESVMQRAESYSPSIVMGLTLGSIVLSLLLYLRRSRESAIFVGLWAPTILSLGLFYRLVGIGREDT